MEIVKILELTGKGFNADQIKQLNDYKTEDVSALLEAGKSTEEVMALLPIMDKVAPEVPPTPPTPPTSPAGGDGKTPTENEALMEEIKKLKATIQADNLKKASIDKPLEKPTADDVRKGFFEDKSKTK